MNTRKVTNLGLVTEIAASGSIEIFELNEENLKTIGFVDENCWPSGEFLQVIRDLETISPTEFASNVKFWDPLPGGGFRIYNNFIENGNNDE